MPLYDGKVVYSCSDEYGVMDVVDEATARTLHFGTSARQSTMFLHDHQALALIYTRCMMSSLLFVEAPRSALLLGLGGGSLAKFLLHHFPACHLDAVEKRARVVQLARSFFHLPDGPRLQIHTADAADFLATGGGGPYDLVLADIHDRAGMASAVGEANFFAACRRRLTEGGILSINLWAGKEREALDRVRRNLERDFGGQVLQLPVARKSNCVALGLNRSVPRGQSSVLRRRAAELEACLGIEFPELLRALERANPARLKGRVSSE